MMTPGLPEIANTDIQTVLIALARHEDDRLAAMEQQDLEQYWHFGYNPGVTPEWNLYKFLTALDMYRRACRKWEESHHGPQCVVERRDTYLMPKITEFLRVQQEDRYVGER